MFSRAKANLNDAAGTLWTDALLLPFAKQATQWAYGEICRYLNAPWEKPLPSALTYTANTEDITAILPADFWVPEKLQFRLNTSEEWKDCERKDEPLPSRVQNPLDRVVEWTFANRTIIVNKCTQGGFLRLFYSGLIADPTGAADPVLMDNLVDALGYATAAFAARSRGQAELALSNMGSRGDAGPEIRFGAFGAIDNLITIMVKNEQLIHRMPIPFSAGRP